MKKMKPYIMNSLNYSRQWITKHERMPLSMHLQQQKFYLKLGELLQIQANGEDIWQSKETEKLLGINEVN